MDPAGHHVYSEAHPINTALRSCDDKAACDTDVAAALIQDMVYLMGRTANLAEQQMFFKVSSIGSKNINVMQRAFPTVTWIFVYCDPGECATSSC